MKKMIVLLMTMLLTGTMLAGCGKSSEKSHESSTPDSTAAESTEGAAEETESSVSEDTQGGELVELQVFIAASLNNVMQEVGEAYEKEHPDVKIVYNADSSGKLLTQIEEGYECDVFFSAAQKQMNKLQDEDGLVVEGTRRNVVNNQLVVVTYKGSGTQVTGLGDIGQAKSIALADGSVPVGRYTRTAMVALGLLPQAEEPADYTTQQVSDALGGVEISEQSNVSKVLAAVAEQSCEVGTTYYSDTYGHGDDLDILEFVSYDLTGDVLYPIAQVKNDLASEQQKEAAADFAAFVASDEMKAVFEKYYFDTNVE